MALIVNGEVVAAAQEGRFTRKKHDAGFPAHAVRYCLDSQRLSLAEIDAVVYYEKPGGSRAFVWSNFRSVG